MRAATILLLITAAFAQQSVDRTFYFTHTESVQDIQEISTLIRAIGELPQASVDTAQRTLSVQGTATQVALAQWLFSELDKAPVQQNQDQTTHEYRAPGSDDVVRVFYVPYAATALEFQEIAVLVRSIAQIRRVFTYNAPRALTMRGTADQAALAAWLINNLNVSATQRAAAHEYRMPGASDDVVRVFYLTNPGTVQEFQEIATVVRNIGDIRYFFTYNGPKAVAVRGTREQMGLAEWLLHELDKPASGTIVAQQAQDQAAHEYRVSEREGVVHVYYLTDIASVEHFHEIVTSVRKTSNMRYTFTYDSPRAVAVRGTAEQVALADRLIKEQDKP